MIYVLMVLGVVVAGIGCRICRVFAASVREMADPEAMFQVVGGPVTEDDEPGFIKIYEKTNVWAMFHGFGFDRYVRFSSNISKRTIKSVFWRKSDNLHVLCMYYVDGRENYDIVSAFGFDKGLTTSSSLDAGFLPNTPAKLAQWFPGLTLNELWELHVEAEKYLERKKGWRLQAVERDIVLVAISAMKKQAAYIMRLLAWQVRGLYWYFVKRKVLAGKKISEKVL